MLPQKPGRGRRRGSRKPQGPFSGIRESEQRNETEARRDTWPGAQIPTSQGACGTTADEKPTGHHLQGEARRQQRTPGRAPQNAKRPPALKGGHPTIKPGNKPVKAHPVLDQAMLRSLKGKGPNEVARSLNDSMHQLKSFLNLPDDRHICEEFIFDLLCVLAVAVDAQSSEKTNEILVTLKGSVFWTKRVPTLLDRVQAEKTALDGESLKTLFQALLTIFFTYLRHFPSSFNDLPWEQLQRTLNQSNTEGKVALHKQLDAFKQERDDIIRAHRQRHGKRYTEKKGEIPPNNFREIPVCPTSEEVVSNQSPFLRKNITKGRYEDTEHYLDVQFRLLREDFLQPLREGIHEIIQNTPKRERKQMMKYYQNVRILDKRFTWSGITYKVEFDASKFGETRWAHSKRLIYGSFLCFSKDNFQTMLFATVANRDPPELKKGRFDIRFIEEQDTFGVENNSGHLFQMVESPAYFEAYRHVLKGLKELDEDSLPFKKYLVEGSFDVDPPKYLIRTKEQKPVYYHLDKTRASRTAVLQPEEWPSAEKLSLNSSQLEALKTAITTEFSVIQGPPGTGKTYVGAKIVSILLKNRRQWDPTYTSPMLMVCYTNHALDQFLEKLLEFLPSRKIIRVGGRCKSSNLKDCNLKIFAGRYRDKDRSNKIRNLIKHVISHIEESKGRLQKADNQLLEFEDLEELMDVRHMEQLYRARFPPNVERECHKPANTLQLWLCNNRQVDKCNQITDTSKNSSENEDQDGSILSDLTGKGYEVLDNVLKFSTQSFDNGNVFHDELATSDGHPLDKRFHNTDEAKFGCLTNDSTTENDEEGLLSGFRQFNQMKGTLDVHGETVENDGHPHRLTKENEITFAQEEVQSHPTSLSMKTPQLRSHESEEFNDQREQTESERSIETVVIEEEASLIGDQRCMEGETVFLPVEIKRSDEEKTRKQDEEKMKQESHEGWIVDISRQGKAKEFSWEQNTNTASIVKHRGAKLPINRDRNDTTTSQRKPSKKKTQISLKPTAKEKGSIRKQLKKEEMMSTDEALGVANIWFLAPNDRLRLYLHWVECYRGRQKIDIQRGEEGYEQLCSELEAIRAEEEEQVLRHATVVGMTTSCAARYHTMLQRIAPKIVVIEEAAEVMEAHIITSLSRDTEHTILIGDHKQLRPKATVYKLAKEYNLEISLFERMVKNKMDCKCLNIQHRMRPEIAELTKKIYDHEIADSESVCHFENVSGVSHNLFFIDHCQPERLIAGLQSYSNPHEASFLVAFCNYLLFQGYERHQITILTMYTGQLLELQGKMPRRRFGGVRVCAVDNFQGEENDIILLSLVRSNKEGSIGFLKETNRICVALSRARQGFYCIGNFSLLSKESERWKEICDDLKTKRAIGETLELVCAKHKNRSHVQTSRDFDKCPFGGCGKPCEDRLHCGHACEKLCHAFDQCHEEGECCKTCLICCPNGHQCQERCHYPRPCNQCNYLVIKKIPQCNHELMMLCWEDPTTFTCKAKCEMILKCGHDCKQLCREPCTSQCKEKSETKLPCGHVAVIACNIDPITYGGCKQTCTRSLECGHLCSKKCNEPCQCNRRVPLKLPCTHTVKVLCTKRDEPQQCVQKCRRPLKCGHICPGLCNEKCSSHKCEVLVDTKLDCGHSCKQLCGSQLVQTVCSEMITVTLKCNHEQVVRCQDYPNNVKCNKQCGKKCKRGHPCQKQCHEGSPCDICMVTETKTISKCKHSFKLPCYVDPDVLVCWKPCERERICKHPCNGICGENCESRPCMTLVTTLHSGHTARLPCSTAGASCSGESCALNVLKELPCKHKAVMRCSEKPENVPCNAPCERRLPCKHPCPGRCSDDCKKFKCSIKEKKPLTCAGNHQLSVKCSDDVSQIVCQKKCTRKLQCGHPCPGKCSDDCNKFKCSIKEKKTLPCAGNHQLRVSCSDDVSQIVCPKKCTKKLQCGHRCPGKCAEECHQYQCQKMIPKPISCPGKHWQIMPCSATLSNVTCQESCTQNLECGHPCPGRCKEDCKTMKCLQKTILKFPCGHSSEISCFKSKTAICEFPCSRKKDSCEHSSGGICGEPCSKYPCEEPVIRELSCGHNIEMLCNHLPESVLCPASCGAQLQCGHKCQGTCSKCQKRGSHELCQNLCGRLLVCSHRCKASCSEPCPPCDKQCPRRCPHGKCTGHCAEPCEPCQLPCTWSCPHYQCNNLCGEACDRLPCTAPCLKLLPCRHPCIGLCGENCPSVCRICNVKQLPLRGIQDKSQRYIQLFDCGHVVRVEEMDAWMQEDQGTDVQLRRCPNCSTPITFSYRYGNHIKSTLENLEKVKSQIQELKCEAVSSVCSFRRKLMLNNSKFRSQISKLLHGDKNLCIVPSIVTLKNHLDVLFEIQETHRLLQMEEIEWMTLLKDTAVTKRYSEIERRSFGIKGALKKMEAYLQRHQLDLECLHQVYELSRKFSAFSQILVTERMAVKHKISFSSMGATLLELAQKKLDEFLQGNNDALDFEWLLEIANSLRKEVPLPGLTWDSTWDSTWDRLGNTKDFENFPGFCRSAWKVCEQGQVHMKRLIIRNNNHLHVERKCHRCTTTKGEQEEQE